MTAKIETFTKVASVAIPIACGIMIAFSFLGQVAAILAAVATMLWVFLLESPRSYRKTLARRIRESQPQGTPQQSRIVQ